MNLEKTFKVPIARLSCYVVSEYDHIWLIAGLAYVAILVSNLEHMTFAFI